MESILLKPRQAQIRTMVIVLGILCALSLSVPLLVLPAALLMPLFTCPLVRHREEWLCWVSAVVPFASATLLHGFDVSLSVGLLLPSLLPMLVTRFLPARERLGARGMAWYIGAEALAMTFMVALFMRHLGGPLQATLPQWICDRIAASETPGLILYRLASAGLLTVPETAHGNSVLMHLLEPLFIHQMLLSLRTTLEQTCMGMLTCLFVHGCVLLGLFTALRTEKLNNVVLVVQTDPQKPSERKTSVSAPPGFRMFMPPPAIRRLLIAGMIAALLFSSKPGIDATLSSMIYYSFNVVFQLQGAAVAIFVFTHRHPDSVTLIGILTGIIYVIAPQALLLIGLAEPLFHFRTHHVRETDES